MSIAATMSNALSGLTVASRAAELVSSNVANALTDGYARRELQVTARSVGSTGQGAQVVGVRRAVDPVVIADRRVAQAGAGDRGLRAGALARIESALGSPEADGSLTDRIAMLEAALVEAASRPDSDARLGAVADAGRALAAKLRDATGEVQAVRMAADAAIAQDVGRINDALDQVARLNAQIQGLGGTGRDPSALIDQRQQVIDGIATLVPLREIDRGNGLVALYTTGGAALLDGTQPSRLGFEPVGVIVAEMSAAGGVLSGLTLNGRAADTGSQGLFAGGELAARFALRDEIAPRAQADLDAVARDLIERLQAPGPDGTIGPGMPGLFMDGTTALDPAEETGIAGRIVWNPAADPDRGGALWRLRDGLGAPAPGATGDSALLVALGEALRMPRATASGSTAGGVRSLADLAAQAASRIAGSRLAADTEVSFSAARAEALRQAELDGGIDTDREMQDLLMIERAYGANARVVQTVDTMIKLILEI
ncbi:MAG: flagellar hook-associated protein FlgK [Paracoccaceae bacterium]|nr:MAG: flagellar hook-associated protein FlgK [Paracoccaceae bacterium]